jgi:hypothetical protein
LALRLHFSRAEGQVDVAQRSVEILIGRLITDEAFRSAFCDDSKAALEAFIESGYELTAIEIAALTATPLVFWVRAARQVDPRLQKASLTSRNR